MGARERAAHGERRPADGRRRLAGFEGCNPPAFNAAAVTMNATKAAPLNTACYSPIIANP